MMACAAGIWASPPNTRESRAASTWHRRSWRLPSCLQEIVGKQIKSDSMRVVVKFFTSPGVSDAYRPLTSPDLVGAMLVSDRKYGGGGGEPTPDPSRARAAVHSTTQQPPHSF